MIPISVTTNPVTIRIHGPDALNGEVLSAVQAHPDAEIVILNSCVLGQDALSAVAELGRLRSLVIENGAITDDGLLILRESQFPCLKLFSIRRCAISDSCSEVIAGLRNVRTLALLDVPVTDLIVDSLVHLPRLCGLYLVNVFLTDIGLAKLAVSTQVDTLDLSLTDISDLGLHSLAMMSTLRDLSFRGCRVTERGVGALASLGLVSLDLGGTRISGAIADVIPRFRQLRRVWLCDTSVTSADVARLRSLCPEIEIRQDPRRSWIWRERANRGAPE